ncbi:hypothetical protein McanMca71_006213 [Microsporum canis]
MIDLAGMSIGWSTPLMHAWRASWLLRLARVSNTWTASGPQAKDQGLCTNMDLTAADNKFNHQGTRIIEYMMRDEEGVYNALQEEAGVDKAWIRWKDFKVFDSFCRTCPPKADGCHPDYCGDDYIQHKEFPRCIEDKNKIEVENPTILHLEDLSVLTFATLLEMNIGVSSKSIEEVKKEKDRKTTELVLIVLIYLLRDLSAGQLASPLTLLWLHLLSV